MTPKEKSNELLRKYWNSKFNMSLVMAKECALIAINEILAICPLPNRDYYEEVKQEIGKL